MDIQEIKKKIEQLETCCDINNNTMVLRYQILQILDKYNLDKNNKISYADDYKKKFYKVKQVIMACQQYSADIKIDELLDYMERVEEDTNADPLEGWDK